MKLLSKINRTYFKYGLIIFLVADFVIISLSSYILKQEMDEELRFEATELVETFKKDNSIHNIYPTTVVEKVDANYKLVSISKDTLIYNNNQKELAPFREYSTVIITNNQKYKITTRHMLMEFNDIFTLFTSLISVVLFLIFIGFLFFTQRLNSLIWNGFNKNVEQLKSYSFDSHIKLHLSETKIDEFDELNQVLINLSDRLELDYKASKEFSANAAHEIQTPLSIIRSKCENLFSKPNLDDETIASLRDIYLTTDRLSGIGKALLLLAKIDHGQFNTIESISLSEIFNSYLNSYQEIIQDRELIVNISETQPCLINMDKRLANLLIQNIFINAINHSSKGKEILIKLSVDSFTISNQGEEAIQNPDQIFNRFYKEDQNQGSTGIGLAIVKKIADHYNFRMTYLFKDFKHNFTFHL
ncbi:sensor histidine kinase KdpD [Ancylomarina sp. 16SWW S1-10-2]|uniref:sensor histidine kinase n=1 Tax=Ancylomarina sp. 16SWW S1-10-2 TaxID=2499681 RepID=UPI0012AD8382|nr:HAMP domain-containing sensor histidine kinase [Ancylomarina sp. 16SWW S1-10-2]MRT91721.1 HAMP domain-containing histidine kinase [Ancylomarina sp. 16SWW S1-10-2]